MALTVIEVLRPGEFDRICSLKVTEPSPGTAMLVFGAGFADSPGRFVPKMVVLPAEPGPEAVQLLLTTDAVNWPLPSLTLAVLAELFAVLVWEPSRLLEVDTVSTPADNSIGTVADANLFVNGPPPLVGRVTWGIGPELTGTFPASSFTATLSPKAPPPTEVTSALAGPVASSPASTTEPTVGKTTHVAVRVERESSALDAM